MYELNDVKKQFNHLKQDTDKQTLLNKSELLKYEEIAKNVM